MTGDPRWDPSMTARRPLEDTAKALDDLAAGRPLLIPRPLLADLGWREALAMDPAMARGLSTFGGRVTNANVAEALSRPYLATADALVQAGGPVGG